METIFSTERLWARRWCPAQDSEAALRIYGDPDVVRYIGNSLVVDVEDQRARLQRALDRWDFSSGRYGSWAVLEKASGELVGAALLKPLPVSNSQLAVLSDDVEIGWHVAKRHWGRGIATEMGRALLRRGFESLDLDELHAVVQSANIASQRIAEKIGMRHTGLTQRYYDMDLEHFALAREEWRTTGSRRS